MYTFIFAKFEGKRLHGLDLSESLGKVIQRKWYLVFIYAGKGDLYDGKKLKAASCSSKWTLRRKVYFWSDYGKASQDTVGHQISIDTN